MIYRKESSAGFSLIEVLVALLIFSLGLIGLAGLLVMSTQANNGALIRTQATFLAQNMADRMRANIGAVCGRGTTTTPGQFPPRLRPVMRQAPASPLIWRRGTR